MAVSKKKSAPKKTAAKKTPAPAVAVKGAKGSDKLVGDLLKVFQRQVPADDLAGWSKADLNAVAQMMCDVARDRKPGQHKVRVFTPTLARDGWHTPHSVAVLINDDMPFIIDSVSSEIAFEGYNIETLFHPILSVRRDKAMLSALTDAPANGQHNSDGLTESFVFVRLEQMLSADGCARLADALTSTLTDVRTATTDWRQMLKKADDIVGRMGAMTGHEWDDVKEARDFMAYVRDNNFTFLGYREYKFSEKQGRTISKAVAGSDLGVLKSAGHIYFDDDNGSPEAEALAQSRWPVMVSKLIDQYATVHRRVPMDVISVKIQDDKGHLTGMHVFTGLFTSSTYSCRTGEVPMVRQKVRETIERAGFKKGSHDAKALDHILEKMPRDELFQVAPEDLYNLSLGILRMQSKQRIALFTHLDPMKQYMSCLVYVPRDRYNTNFRLQAVRILEAGIQGRVTNFFTMLDDSALARILFTVRLNDMNAQYDHARVEQQLIDLGREWDERLRNVLIEAAGKVEGTELAHVYGRAFTAAYHESIDIKNAVHDIRNLEGIVRGNETIRLDFYRLNDAPAGEFRLKVYNRGNPVPLSDILPVLDNMGLRAISEMPFEVNPHNFGAEVWIHDFVLQGDPKIDLEQVKQNFEEMFLAVWKGATENDGLNALVLLANLNWREVLMLRAYNSYMRQARFPYSRRYVEQVLALYPAITRELVALFHAMHDPRGKGDGASVAARITDMLQTVEKLDQDRILRSMMTLIENTLRTNYYQTGADGLPKALVAMKLNSKNLLDLPLPRPHVEIFVYSSRVEAVHLRGGEIARGGIRWSDRHDDFRTEILGLLKAQQVKNTVIVPVGAKGGFVVKQPPKEGGRAAYQAEGVECYKIFVQSLLDITDNSVKGKIIRPKDVVCHDGIDPYLVVAADKGTATFSDTANSLSLQSGFWLGDAFASGGSAGYDHKVMGITARGGWECVKRHFRELGKDIQSEPFTVIGVGDMGGDVFGNAMLLSRKIRLQAAFNHVHIFFDPEPDMEKSFAERERLFNERGGWDAYDKSKLSAGGAIYERSAKTLKLTPQIKKLLGLNVDNITPDELIRAILRHDAELLWFGGIGTYMKSSKQSHADADDKSNDSLRVDAREVRAKVIGEGANLGVTQLARIEFAQKGGKINTDFIDNSAGVDCSDHEVNIKILLADVMQRHDMSLAQRNKLLASMTDDVADLVLADNYQQSQSLSFQSMLAKDLVNLHLEFIRRLEKDNLINRTLEGLPDEEGFARMAREGLGLTRPELSVLTSNAKIVIYNQVLQTAIPDDPSLEHLLIDYFPKALRKYVKEIKSHKLRREIVATQVVNILVNRMGAVFVQSRMSKTGATAEEVVRAFLIVLNVFPIQKMWDAIEALDNKAPAAVQLAALNDTYVTVKRAVTWFLRFGSEGLNLAKETGLFRPAMEFLQKSAAPLMPPSVQDKLAGSAHHLKSQGVPAALADDIALMKQLASAADIINIAHTTKSDLARITRTYFIVGETLGLDWLRGKTSDLVTENSWQARVKSGILDDLYHHQAVLTSILVKKSGKGKADGDVFAAHGDIVAAVDQMVNELRHQESIKLEMLVLVTQRIGQLVSECVQQASR